MFRQYFSKKYRPKSWNVQSMNIGLLLSFYGSSTLTGKKLFFLQNPLKVCQVTRKVSRNVSMASNEQLTTQSPEFGIAIGFFLEKYPRNAQMESVCFPEVKSIAIQIFSHRPKSTNDLKFAQRKSADTWTGCKTVPSERGRGSCILGAAPIPTEGVWNTETRREAVPPFTTSSHFDSIDLLPEWGRSCRCCCSVGLNRRRQRNVAKSDLKHFVVQFLFFQGAINTHKFTLQ